MQDCKVIILGSEWSISYGNSLEYPMLTEADGYSDSSTREIVISDMRKSDVNSKGNLSVVQKQTLRHELIHAFMEESGLSENFEHKEIGIDETMVDWFAIQSPKIFKVFTDLELL